MCYFPFDLPEHPVELYQNILLELRWLFLVRSRHYLFLNLSELKTKKGKILSNKTNQAYNRHQKLRETVQYYSHFQILQIVYFPFRENRVYISETHPEPCQISKTERFAKIVNEKKLLITFAKRSVLDVWESSEYASVESLKIERNHSEKRMQFLVTSNEQTIICYGALCRRL